MLYTLAMITWSVLLAATGVVYWYSRKHPPFKGE